jgi:hypothetical protein
VVTTAACANDVDDLVKEGFAGMKALTAKVRQRNTVGRWGSWSVVNVIAFELNSFAGQVASLAAVLPTGSSLDVTINWTIPSFIGETNAGLSYARTLSPVYIDSALSFSPTEDTALTQTITVNRGVEYTFKVVPKNSVVPFGDYIANEKTTVFTVPAIIPFEVAADMVGSIGLDQDANNEFTYGVYISYEGWNNGGAEITDHIITMTYNDDQSAQIVVAIQSLCSQTIKLGTGKNP